MDKRQLFVGDLVVRTDNVFGRPEGSIGVVKQNLSGHYRVRWVGDQENDSRDYYARELGLIIEQHNNW